MIRKSEIKDIEIIMSIWLTSTLEAHDFISKTYWENSYATVKEVYLPIAKTYVYEENSKIKGFISLIDETFIGALFVDPASQGMGIGKQLIKKAMETNPSLSLAVYKENEKSVQFYLSQNFKIVSEQVNEDSGHLEYLMQN